MPVGTGGCECDLCAVAGFLGRVSPASVEGVIFCEELNGRDRFSCLNNVNLIARWTLTASTLAGRGSPALERMAKNIN
jgi:hypothetical protein